MNYCFPASRSMAVAWELNIQSDIDLQHALLILLSTVTANNKHLKQRKRRISFPSFHYHIFNWLGISFAFVKTYSAKPLLQIWMEEPGTMREKPKKSPCKWRFLPVEAQQGGTGAVSAHPHLHHQPHQQSSVLQLLPRLKCRAGDKEVPTQVDLLSWSEGTWERYRNHYGKKGIKRKYGGKSPTRSSEANSWVTNSQCYGEISFKSMRSRRPWKGDPVRGSMARGGSKGK